MTLKTEGARPPRYELTDRSRVHVATRAPIMKPGGLHSVVRGLAGGQHEIGLKPTVLHSIRRPLAGLSTLWVPESTTASRLPAPPVDAELSTAHLEPAEPVYPGPLAEYHFAQTAIDLRFDATLAKIPSVFHFHGPWHKEGRVQGESGLRVMGKRLIEHLAYRRFAVFTTHSSAFAQELNQTFRVPATQIEVVHPGIDTIRFCPGDQRAARALLGADPDRATFVAVRRLEPRMGLDLAISAMVNFPDAQLLLAGSGSLLESLRALAGDLGVLSRVHFLGRVTDELLPAVYQSADVSLVPTRDLEGFGLVVLESYAAGTPVIAANVGGLAEAMGRWSSDWTFDAGDLNGLIALMAEGLRAAPNSAELRSHAQSHSWAAAARHIEAIAFSRL